MRKQDAFDVIYTHTEGEPLCIVHSGIPYPAGSSILEKRAFLEQNYDWVDSFAVFEVINRTGTGFIGTAFLPTDVNVCSASDLERIP